MCSKHVYSGIKKERPGSPRCYFSICLKALWCKFQQISVQGKVSPKAYLQRQDLAPFSWHHLIMGVLPPLVFNLFLDFLPFSPQGHFRCANALWRKPMWPFYQFSKITITIHIFAFPQVRESLCHLSGTPQQIERSPDFGSPPATAKLITGWPGWPCWSRRPTQNMHAIESIYSNAHKHVLNRSKLRQQLQSKSPAQHFWNLTSDTLHECWTHCVMAGIFTYAIYFPTNIFLNHVESSWGPETICPLLNPYQDPLYQGDPEVQWACIHEQFHQQTARHLLP